MDDAPGALLASTSRTEVLPNGDVVAADDVAMISAGTYWLIAKWDTAPTIIKAGSGSVPGWYLDSGGSPASMPITLPEGTTYVEERYAYWVEGFLATQ